MSRLALKFSCVLIFATTLVCSADRLAGTTNVDPAQTAIQLIPVASGLFGPAYMTSSHDGSNRLFIVELDGVIKTMMPGATAPLPTPFLDLNAIGVDGGLLGLFGLAFHPDYESNGRFFVNYTRLDDNATVVSEFRVSAGDPNVAGTEERILLAIPKPFNILNGGWIDFGPDGFLYIATGDGSPGNDPQNEAQNKDSLLGKILRIDVNAGGNAPYVSPPANPFFGPTPGRDEIYATGFRNPWRGSFDRATGKLHVGDVGDGRVEEVDIVTHGGNCGWRIFEGSRCTDFGPAPCVASNFITPLLEYSHFTNGRCAVIGGYVYRGTGNSLPAGGYVFGDHCSGEIFLWDGAAMNVMLDTDIMITSFAEDEAGEIYVVGLGGTIHRIARLAAMPVSAASFRGLRFAPDSIAAAFGLNLATSTQSAPEGQPLPVTLAGVSVRVVDAMKTSRLARLLFVSPTQVNFLIPPGTAPGPGTISFRNANGATSIANVEFVNVEPGLFTANSSGSGIAAAVALRVKANGSQTFEPVVKLDSENQLVPVPIDLGPDLGNASDRVFLIAFGTGFRLRSSLGAASVTIGGTPTPALFVGAQPNFAGLDQANVLLPRSLIGRGDVDVVLTVDGREANTVRLRIQ
ncbi:MAG TPA: PQQ-dependent sugar dehydrogenase [Blastocatellia bacterium]|nr:PQQ-dependent sugar dehydrogenase [Blastocatellia bacterium]